jgi:DNA-binding NarL/FixJ family response regulator
MLRPTRVLGRDHRCELTAADIPDEVLALLERGRSTEQIADELHLSRETVRNHVRHMLRAIGVNSRLEAVAAARGELVVH